MGRALLQIYMKVAIKHRYIMLRIVEDPVPGLNCVVGSLGPILYTVLSGQLYSAVPAILYSS